MLTVWRKCSEDSNELLNIIYYPWFSSLPFHCLTSTEAHIKCKLYTASAIFMFKDILASQRGINDWRRRYVGDAALSAAFTLTDLLLPSHFMQLRDRRISRIFFKYLPLCVYIPTLTWNLHLEVIWYGCTLIISKSGACPLDWVTPSQEEQDKNVVEGRKSVILLV